MGYYHKVEPDAAPRVISFAQPKTHTPGSPVKDRGHRYYMPETGRWASRDPIGESVFRSRYRSTPIEPLYVFVKNTPAGRFDVLGLLSAEQHCESAFENFLNANPDWKKKKDEMEKSSKCFIGFQCACCKKGDTSIPRACWEDGVAGCMTPPNEGTKGIRYFTITACWNRGGIDASMIAHEMSHVMQECNGGDDPCSAEKTGTPGYETCACAKSLCGEMRAFYDAHQCNDWNDCWDKFISKYLASNIPCVLAAKDGVSSGKVKDRARAMCGKLSRTLPKPSPIPGPDL